MHWDGGNPRARSRKTIGEEWVGWLPPKKAEAFASAKSALYADSWMLQVALNEGIGLSRQGSPPPAFELAAVCSDLFARLSARIEAALRTLHRSSHNFGILPNCAPLSAEFFRSEIARNRAKRSRLFSYLMANNSQFSLKLDDLVLIVCGLSAEFHPVAGEVGGGCPANPQRSWDRMEVLEYDLNTCLGETLVGLKSFLNVLPESETQLFQKQIEAAVRSSARRVSLGRAAVKNQEDADSARGPLARRRRHSSS